MKKHLLLLIIAILSINFGFTQQISGPKPIIKVLDNVTGDYIVPDPAAQNTSLLGCNIGAYSIKATWTDIGSPDEYRVESIPYKPKAYLRNLGGTILPPTNGQILTPAILPDDYWSSVQNLASNGTDLNFCYFGNRRNQFIINENGAVSFDLSKAGNHDGPSWQFHNMGKISPDANLNPFNESIILGLDTYYQDSSRLTDSYSFWDILGATDERYFILGYHHLPLYSSGSGCGDTYGFVTMQMVFYETTNVIEYHIQDKPLCYSWDGSKFSALGIQNDGRTKGYAIPGRDNLDYYQILDLTDGFYDSNFNSDPDPNGTVHQVDPSESWRFIPDGVLGVAPSFQWYTNYNHATHTGTPFGAADNPDLSITVDDLVNNSLTSITYTAVVTYTDYCTGVVVHSAVDYTFDLEDPFLMHIKEENSTDNNTEFEFIETINLCVGDDYDLEAWIQNFDNTDGSTVTYSWTMQEFPTPATQVGTNQIYSITNAVEGTYVYEVVVEHDTTVNGGGVCSTDDKINVIVTLDAVSFDVPSPAIFCGSDADVPLINVTPTGGIFTINNGGVWVNPETDPLESLDGLVDLSASGSGDDNTGVFTISYTAGCTSITVQQTLTINDAPVLTPPTTGISLCATNVGLNTADFDMAAIEAEILNGQTGLVLSYQYNTGSGPITVATMPNPFNTTSISNIKLTASVPGAPASCVTELFFDLIVSPKPSAGTPTYGLELCENPTLNDGEASFDGNYINNTILNGLTGANYVIVYEGDRNGTTVTMPSPLPASYIASSMTVTAYIDNTNSTCDSNPITFNLVVRETPIITNITTGLIACETNVINHTASYDTSSWTNTILSGNPSPINSDFIVEYTYNDGSGNVTVNTMPNPLITTSQTILIIARNVTAGQQTCPSNALTFDLVVNPLPVGTDQTPTTCSDVAVNYDINSFTTGTGNTYSWAATDNPNVTGETTTASTATSVTDTLTNTSGVDQTIIYTITPTGANTCVGADFTISVTVNPEPVGTTDVVPACSNVAVSIDLNTFTTGGAGNTYSWVATDNPDITGETTANSTSATITDTLLNTSATAQDIIYTITPTGANGCAGDSFIITVNVGEEPVGTAQTPNACSDIALSLDLTTFTTLTGNTYSWIATDNPAVTGESTTATSTTNITDTLNNVSGTPQDVVYTVTPTSANGCLGNSFTVTVTVNEEPVGTNQTPTTCSDVALSLDLNSFTTGTGNTYSFIATDNPNITGESTTAIAATSITDSLTNTSGTDQIVIYTVTPTSTSACVGTDFTVSVTVNPEPVGTDDIVPACSNVAVNVDISTFVTGTGNTYSWVATDNPNITGETTTVSSANFITDTLVNTGTAAQDIIYTVTPTGANGCDGDPFTITINVGEEPVGTAQTPTTCSDTALNLDLTTFTTLTGNTYSWIATDNPNVTGETTTATSTSNITDTLNNVSGTPQDVVYTITPTSAGGCLGNPFTVTVTVNEEPVGTNQTPGTCSDVSLNLDLNTYVTGTGNTFSWIASDNADISGETTTQTTSSSIADTLTNVSGALQDVTYTVTPTGANGCEGNPFTVIVTVADEPVGTDSFETVCSDDILLFDLGNYTTGTGNTYTFIAADNPNVTGESTTLQNTNAITDTLNNVSGTAQDIVYTVTPTGGCMGDEFTVTITVNPEPVGANTTLDACSNLAFDFNLDNYTTLTGNTYSWMATDNPNITGETITATSGNIIDTLINTTGVVEDVLYTVTPTSADGCEGNSFTITIQVGFEPIGTAQTPTTCSDDVLSLDLESFTSQTGNTFSWVATDNPDVTGEFSGTSTAAFITDTLNNVSNVNQDVTYTVTPTSANNCEGSPFTVTVTVQPEPVGVNTTEAACSDTAMNLSLTDYTTLGSTYSWVATDNPNVTGETTAVTTTAFITDTLNNVSGSSQVVDYTITVTSANGCVGDPFVISVTVGEEPVGTPDTVIACSDVELSVDLNTHTTLTGNTYSWIATDNPNVTGETVATSTDISITDTLTNTSGSVQNVVYTVTPTSASGCMGNSFIITIEVGFEPVGTDTTEIVCNDETLSLDLSNYTTLTGNTYTWMAIDNPNVDGETTTETQADFITDTITNVSGSMQTVEYLVVPTSAGGCLGDVFTVSVDVNSRPVFELNSQYYICPETQIATIGEDTNPTNLTYEWFVATDMTTPIGFDLTLDVTENDIMTNGGAYALTATDTNGCVFSQFTSISMAEQLEITTIFVSDFNRPDNTITIEITGGSGQYEFSLTDEDNNTTTQTSNVFTNVLAGTFEIEVVDLTGCSITRTQDNIYVLDYPAFFTPNGDLNYDTWQITGAHLIPNSKIYIYDRFGKVLAQIDPNSVVGWDGLYNGKQMPASDYWFTAEYIDPNTLQQKTVRGNFSIIRK